MHTDGIHLHYFVLPGFDLLTRTLGLVGLRLRSQKLGLIDKLLLEHVGLPHVLDLEVHLVNFLAG